VKIGWIDRGYAPPDAIFDAAQKLGAEIVPHLSPQDGGDLVLIDLPAAAEESLAEGTVPVFLVMDAADSESAVHRLQQSGCGVVRTSAALADLQHAVRLAEAIALVPLRPTPLPPLLVRAELCHRLPNDPDLAFAWASELCRDAVQRLECPTATAFRLASAAVEAVENAMLRGNLEISSALFDAGDAAIVAQLLTTRRRQSPFRERSVWASCRFSAEEIRLVIRDEGPGFASAPDWPAGVAAPLPGRGGLILRALCDAVRYNADGNEVTLLVHPFGAAVGGDSQAPLVERAVSSPLNAESP
jgi:hypothetical protein